MNKELKKELFNIYDMVVFEDENGITQDCVCVIGKDKEVDKEVNMIECNNHSISIYEDGSYKVWEKDGKNMPYCVTTKKITHIYTLKNDNRFYEIYPTNDYEIIDNAKPSDEVLKAFNRLMEESPEVHTESYNLVYAALQRLEAIDNAKPNEALKGLEFICKILNEKGIDVKWLFKKDYNTIKQALQKAQQFDKAYEDVKALPLESLIETYKKDIVLDIFTKEIEQLKQENADYKEVLRIINEKNVDIYVLQKFKTVDEYNSKIVHIFGETRELTQEEFDLLKKYANKVNNNGQD